MSHTQFEPNSPGIFEGVATVTVQEPGLAPSGVINTMAPFQIDVEWELKGIVPPTFDSYPPGVEWQATAYLEALGSGTDVVLGTQTIDLNAGTPGGPGERQYAVSVNVAPGTPAGAYRLVTIILAEDTGSGNKLPYAAFVDGPTLQLFESP